MDYKEKYNAALEIAKECLQDGTITTIARDYIWEIFPELKGSKDERIREELIQHIKANKYADYVLFQKFSPDDVIAWLERQGKQKTDPCANCINDKGCITCENGNLKETKVAPKFKVGDWITDGYIHYKITEILDDRYIIESIYTKRDAILFEHENRYHLWTINDAKDGDVLTNGEIIVIFKQIVEPKYRQYIEAHIGLDWGYNIQVTSESWSLGIDKAMPATKEQYDLLFQKMKETGYEWDKDKKELKKIEIGSNQVISEIVKNQKEIPSEFTKLVHENFWDLTNKIEPKMLDPDKVIKWLNDQACFGYIEVEVDKLVKQFKRDSDQ